MRTETLNEIPLSKTLKRRIARLSGAILRSVPVREIKSLAGLKEAPQSIWRYLRGHTQISDDAAARLVALLATDKRDFETVLKSFESGSFGTDAEELLLHEFLFFNHSERRATWLLDHIAKAESEATLSVSYYRNFPFYLMSDHMLRTIARKMCPVSGTLEQIRRGFIRFERGRRDLLWRTDGPQMRLLMMPHSAFLDFVDCAPPYDIFNPGDVLNCVQNLYEAVRAGRLQFFTVGDYPTDSDNLPNPPVEITSVDHRLWLHYDKSPASGMFLNRNPNAPIPRIAANLTHELGCVGQTIEVPADDDQTMESFLLAIIMSRHGKGANATQLGPPVDSLNVVPSGSRPPPGEEGIDWVWNARINRYTILSGNAYSS